MRDLDPLLGVRWPELDHRSVRSRLSRLGWTDCGEGDWAFALRSPSGRLVARVSPFEPAYGHFVSLCRRCPGNLHLPRLDLATPLPGGGHLAVLEYLRPAPAEVAADFLRRWSDPGDLDADLRALRREAAAIDRWGREHVRWWGGLDIGERHVLLSADGAPKLIDLFCVRGNELFAALLADPRGFGQVVPPDQRRYLLDIPDLQHDHAGDYVPRLRSALAQADSSVRAPSSERVPGDAAG